MSIFFWFASFNLLDITAELWSFHEILSGFSPAINSESANALNLFHSNFSPLWLLMICASRLESGPLFFSDVDLLCVAHRWFTWQTTFLVSEFKRFFREEWTPQISQGFPRLPPMHNWFQSHRTGIVQGRFFLKKKKRQKLFTMYQLADATWKRGRFVTISSMLHIQKMPRYHIPLINEVPTDIQRFHKSFSFQLLQHSEILFSFNGSFFTVSGSTRASDYSRLYVQHLSIPEYFYLALDLFLYLSYS